MPLEPEYGDTPIPFDELDALLPAARAALRHPVTHASVYDLEQAIEQDVAVELLSSVLTGSFHLTEILTDSFVRELHRRLYGDIWAWDGRYRRYVYNIGVDWSEIAPRLRQAP